MTGVVLLGIEIDHERDPRQVAREVEEKLSKRGVVAGWQPKARFERGRKPRENAISESHKIEIEFKITGRDLPLVAIHVASQAPQIVAAVGASYDDIRYIEADRARE